MLNVFSRTGRGAFRSGVLGSYRAQCLRLSENYPAATADLIRKDKDRSMLMENNPYFYVTLVRHGETDANKNGIIQGHLNTALNATGRRQAELVAARFQNEHFTHVYSSDLERAARTADKIVDKNMFFKNGKVIHDSRLREKCFGVCEGRTAKEMEEMADSNNLTLRQFVPVGGETTHEIHARVVDSFHTICKKLVLERHAVNMAPERQPFASVLIASHGGTIRQFLNYFGRYLGSKYPAGYKDLLKRGSIFNTGVCKFKISLDLQSKLPNSIKCLVLNNDDHLELNTPCKNVGGEAGLSYDDDADDVIFHGQC